MARIQAFEDYTKDYEAWFERHPYVYQSELQALRKVLPSHGKGIEIGVGSGRFAAPFEIGYGVDPSPRMCTRAAKYPIQITLGTAEFLPIAAAQFDFALMVTTLCFVDDVMQSFREIHRILRPDGVLIIGFVDKESPVGRRYQQNRVKSRFYRDASFYTVKEVLTFLKNTGFHSVDIQQTLFQPLEQIQEMEPVQPGYGKGSFIILKAIKTKIPEKIVYEI